MDGLISLAKTVGGTLKGLGVDVWYFYPQNWMTLPVISWRESGNRECAQADAREHLAALEYTVDVWSGGPEENHALADRVDAAMAGLRLRRDYCADLFDAGVGLHHRVMRYRCVADAAGNVYQ